MERIVSTPIFYACYSYSLLCTSAHRACSRNRQRLDVENAVDPADAAAEAARVARADELAKVTAQVAALQTQVTEVLRRAVSDGGHFNSTNH